MSLVGTRPPTVDEWDKYELHHRARLATKPGLTGMWQVSGRSNITDFEEVVKLDKQYIEECRKIFEITITCDCFIGGQVVKSIYLDILRWNTQNRLNIIIGEFHIFIQYYGDLV